MAATTHKLTEVELLRYENIRLREQMLATHKEMLIIKVNQLEDDRRSLNNKVISARKISADHDVIVDDVKGLIITQPKVASPPQ